MTDEAAVQDRGAAPEPIPPADPAPDRAPTPAAAAGTGDAGGPTPAEPLSTRFRRLAETIGPTTLVTALLIYFGYIATRARFGYFGVSLELTGLSNQSLLLYGLEVVYVPATLALMAILVVIGLHAIVKWRLERFPGDVTNSFIAGGAALVGVLLVGRALIGIFLLSPAEDEVLGATALSLTFGPAAVAYGAWIFGENGSRPLLPAKLARSGIACVVGLFVAGLTWAATQFAFAYGTGRGEEDAEQISSRPEVILDTRDMLVGMPGKVTQTSLSATGAETTFAYRYSGLRLLLSSGGRLFLVPVDWTYGVDQTLVLPYDGTVRIQLIPHGKRIGARRTG